MFPAMMQQKTRAHARMIRLKVKEIAKQKDIGQGLLARMANMDVKTLKRIYRNPYAEISTFTLDKLAKALKVDASELIESVPDELAQDDLPPVPDVLEDDNA